jgi:cold shock CspA family protein
MAKSKATFSKKEKEKKRFQQKQEKAQKMEERKSNSKKGKSLEEMMAYLDEDGNLTDMPRDPRVKKVYAQESIQIGVPKHEDVPDVPRTGTVSFFDHGRGFGFITDDTSHERVYVHVSNLQHQLNESDKVTFFTENGPRGLNAIDVKKLS